jgi:hypothetical protein
MGGFATGEHNIGIQEVEHDCIFRLLFDLVPFSGKSPCDLAGGRLFEAHEYYFCHASLVSLQTVLFSAGRFKDRLAKTIPRHNSTVAPSEN